MQPGASCQPWPPGEMFQSSSGPLAGCNPPFPPAIRVTTGSFNPHPALSPDATRGCGWRGSNSLNGFNPHPALSPDATRLGLVFHRRLDCFNPHPALSPDATGIPVPAYGGQIVSILIRPSRRMQPPDTTVIGSASTMFQSSSGPLAGCNTTRQTLSSHPQKFQSSSGPLAGCNIGEQLIRLLVPCFNPHPALSPDATQE